MEILKKLKKLATKYRIPIEVEEDDGKIVIFCNCNQLIEGCRGCEEKVMEYVDEKFCELKVFAKLMLKKYKLRARIDEGWEDNMRYIILTLQNVSLTRT